MNEEPPRDLATVRSDQAAMWKVITEMRSDIAQMRGDITEMRNDIAELRTQQAAMARNIASIDRRLTALEEQVDTRLKETRPIWEVVKSQIEKLDAKFDEFIRDLYDLRGDLRLHEKRLNTIEGRLQS